MNWLAHRVQPEATDIFGLAGSTTHEGEEKERKDEETALASDGCHRSTGVCGRSPGPGPHPSAGPGRSQPLRPTNRSQAQDAQGKALAEAPPIQEGKAGSPARIVLPRHFFIRSADDAPRTRGASSLIPRRPQSTPPITRIQAKRGEKVTSEGGWAFR